MKSVLSTQVKIAIYSSAFLAVCLLVAGLFGANSLPSGDDVSFTVSTSSSSSEPRLQVQAVGSNFTIHHEESNAQAQEFSLRGPNGTMFRAEVNGGWSPWTELVPSGVQLGSGSLQDGALVEVCGIEPVAALTLHFDRSYGINLQEIPTCA